MAGFPVWHDALSGHAEIAGRMVRRIVDQQQVGEDIRGQRRGSASQSPGIEIAPDVAVYHRKWRFAEQRQRVGNAPRGLQCARRLGRPGNARAKRFAIAEARFEQLAEMGMIDHQIAPPRRDQPLDVPDDQRLAGDFEQWFRTGVGERQHAFAAAGRQNHRLQNVRPALASRASSASSSLSSGPNSR